MATSLPDRTTGRFTTVSSLQAHLFALPDLQDRPYSEALFTTFNVDLAYFEGNVLGPARASGAAVTVIADAAQYEPDPLAVHGAGASYVIGVVDLPTAFHPKVTVLVGEDRLLLAVGSGNLSVGGWLGNDETLFVAQGTRTTGIPAISSDIARWLATIEPLRVGSAGRAGIRRTREAIERLSASTEIVDTGHRLVTTSTGPIVDQLPEGPVDELLLHAPFHDHSGAALTALMNRYRPQRVNIAVQPRRTILDPEVLGSVARDIGVNLTWHDAGDSYRHGKLIEGVRGNTRWVLAGSPNLTGAALLRRLGAGGNCEVGVVSASERSLYPGAGAPLEPAAIPALKIVAAPGEGARPAQALPVLLAAALDEGDVVVEFAAPAQFPTTVEISEYNDLPELTGSLGEIRPGVTEARLQTTRKLGARSRVRIAFDIDGVRHRGPFHFLADPEAALRRIHARRTSSSNTDVNWRALFGDDALLQDWTRTLDKVTREQRAVPASAARSRQKLTESTVGVSADRRTFNDEEAWAQYSEDAIARLGPTLAHESSGGLILPHLARPTESRSMVSSPIWADKFDADESDFDETQTADEVDKVNEPELERESSSPAGLVTSQQKRRFQGWVKNLAKTMDGRPALDRMAITRLVLIASLAPVWDRDDAWFPYLHRAAETLALDDVPDRLLPEVGALASVCLHRLDQGASPDPRTGTGLQYARLVKRLLPLIEDPDTERITSIVHSVYGTSVVKTHPQDVIDLIEGLADENPWPEIVQLIERAHRDWMVSLEVDGHISIEARSGAHFRIAAEALELMPRHLTVAIRVTVGRQFEQRLYARHNGVLAIQDKLGQGLVWKTYRLGDLVSATGIQSNTDTARKAQIDLPPWRGVSATARAVLAAAGVDLDV